MICPEKNFSYLGKKLRCLRCGGLRFVFLLYFWKNYDMSGKIFVCPQKLRYVRKNFSMSGKTLVVVGGGSRLVEASGIVSSCFDIFYVCTADHTSSSSLFSGYSRWTLSFFQVCCILIFLVLIWVPPASSLVPWLIPVLLGCHVARVRVMWGTLRMGCFIWQGVYISIVCVCHQSWVLSIYLVVRFPRLVYVWRYVALTMERVKLSASSFIFWQIYKTVMQDRACRLAGLQGFVWTIHEPSPTELHPPNTIRPFLMLDIRDVPDTVLPDTG
jgi:hypothetical protein